MSEPKLPDNRTPCPNCGRLTQTVGRGTCAECWQPKSPEGEAAIRTPEPRTMPLGLLDVFDDFPDSVFVFALIAVAAIVVGVVLAVLS